MLMPENIEENILKDKLPNKSSHFKEVMLLKLCTGAITTEGMWSALVPYGVGKKWIPNKYVFTGG